MTPLRHRVPYAVLHNYNSVVIKRMCEVLPTIEETPSPSPDEGGDNSKLEHLMMNMLEERDKLMEKLRESQESSAEASRKLAQVEADNTLLMRQLQALMPEEEERLMSVMDELRNSGGVAGSLTDDVKKWPIAKKYIALARELTGTQAKIAEKDEEIQELKSERTNTRLLLEHLECLVARHERSLRMTVVKKQAANRGVSSEVEVLKALKSLFDHHKALDEKVRERLRVAQERNVVLEDELMLASQEIKSLQEESKRMKRLLQQRNSVRLSMCYDNVAFSKEQLALLEERDQTIGDLQFSLDERTAELEEVMRHRDDLLEKVQESQEELQAALQSLQEEQEARQSVNKQAFELKSLTTKLEAQVSELQGQISSSQQDISKLRDEKQQLNNQCATLEAKIVKLEEETSSLRSELKQKELSLEQSTVRTAEQLSAAEQRQGSAESQIQELRTQLETKQQCLISATEKERVNEEHITRLQSTIERMLKESNERMKTHLNERKALSEEKNVQMDKVQALQKELEELKREKNQLLQQKENNRSQKAHYSWQHVADVGALMNAHQGPGPLEATHPVDEGAGGGANGGGEEAADHWDQVEPDNVSKLVSMLEGQVSKLDQKLRSMGENVQQANEFDQVLKQMSDGEYHESSVDPVPLSSPPSSRASHFMWKPESTARVTVYRVNVGSESPVSPGTMATDNQKNVSRTSISKLFRRKSSDREKKPLARRASAPLPSSIVSRESLDISELVSPLDCTAEDKHKKNSMVLELVQRGVPFAQWDTSSVLAWLEVWVACPHWYVEAIKKVIRSGANLESITDVELEKELGITNCLHRLKLRLAVQEIVNLTSSPHPQQARKTSLFGEMGHDWIADYWLPSLGLPQYSDMFKVCLVDARMLEHLTKKDLRTVLKMADNTHRNGLQYGISVLKRVDYKKEELEQRRRTVNVASSKDVLVWTNDHMIQWLDLAGLRQFSGGLKESGVHGGVVALDNDFDHEKLAVAMGVPLSSPEIVRLVKIEFSKLLAERTSRNSVESQSQGKIVRRLSKKLRVSSNRKLPNSYNSDFMSMRPSSPVLLTRGHHFGTILEDAEGQEPYIAPLDPFSSLPDLTDRT
ncbi:hypothetical protein EMCRGX_G010358 [Ephydatia muelleri]